MLHNYNDLKTNGFTSLIMKIIHAYYQNIPIIKDLINYKMKTPVIFDT